MILLFYFDFAAKSEASITSENKQTSEQNENVSNK